MKKPVIIALALLTVLLVASSCQNKQPACTEELKSCPDGSSVARDPGNNCEFSPCPKDLEVKCSDTVFMCPDGRIVYQDPRNNCQFPSCSELQEEDSFSNSRIYTEKNTDTCKTLAFLCVEGATPFYDKTGCGCEAIEPKQYISQDLSECALIKYACAENKIPFTDDKGCGCDVNWESARMPQEAKETYCDPAKRPKYCTMEYNPVCGWFGENIQCIQYPCAANYGNACSACSDSKVAYWTGGECPPADKIRE